MESIKQLRMTSFYMIPEDMKRLSAIEHSRGLHRSALLRLVVSDFVRRAANPKQG